MQGRGRPTRKGVKPRWHRNLPEIERLKRRIAKAERRIVGTESRGMRYELLRGTVSEQAIKEKLEARLAELTNA